MNQPISENEITDAIKAIKDRKAAGTDGLIGEFFKHGIDVILPFLVTFFNFIFDHALYPDEWCLAIVQPLFKKGDPNIADKYKGISLLNVCNKLYSYILNRHITKWISDNGIIGEEQAGFRENYNTTDQTFTLYSLIQKQLIRHRKLYVAFIDFREAFDSVSREKLWKVLTKNGMGGNIVSALRSMYSVVKAKVRAGGV